MAPVELEVRTVGEAGLPPRGAGQLRQGDDISPNLLNTFTNVNLRYYHRKFVGLRADGAVTLRSSAIAARNDELYLKSQE